MESQMKIEVSNFIEQEDGSAIVNLEMDNEAKEFLINQGFIKVLNDGLDRFELEFADKLEPKDDSVSDA